MLAVPMAIGVPLHVKYVGLWPSLTAVLNSSLGRFAVLNQFLLVFAGVPQLRA
jgi:hypothetical protein